MPRIIKFRNPFKAFKNNASTIETAGLNDERLLEWLGIDKNSDGEITYFTCLKKLSETIAKLPLKYMQETEKGKIRAEPDRTTYLLTKRPNAYMTPTTFFGSVELNRNEYGNAYVLCRWQDTKYNGRYSVGRELKDLWLMPSKCVTVWLDDAGIFSNDNGIYYQFSDPKTGKQYWYPQDVVMHFKTSTTYDGIMGKPVRQILKDTIDGAQESQKYLNNLYRSGMTASSVLHYTGTIKEGTEEKLRVKYSKLLSGSKNAGKIVPLPFGFQLEPTNVKLVDSQFFELKKYSALQVAAAFGIKPNQINNYEKSSYSNSESQQLDFLVETISYILKGYEEEINYKLLPMEKQEKDFYYKFNEKAILRTSAETQMNMLKDAVQNAIYAPNEARDKLEMPHKKGGDVLMANGNYIPVTDVGKQYEKGSEK